MRLGFRHFSVWTCLTLAAFVPVDGARGFATGAPLTLTIDPATVRQKSELKTAKVLATIQLKDPSPAVFVCVMRTENESKLGFHNIIFRKGDLKATSEGTVQWKAVRGECRVRVSAYNADAPDRKLTFTVTLIPEQETPGQLTQPYPQ